LEVADKVESLLRAITAGKSVVFQVLQESRDVTVIMSDTRGW
jgi:dephospho-CoA kinase